MLEQIKIDEPMGETDFADLILAISQLEDVRDIFAAPTEAEKVEIMNKWARCISFCAQKSSITFLHICMKMY